MTLPALRTIRDGLLGIAYPVECLVCGRPVLSWDDGIVCADCWDDATRDALPRIACHKCGTPLMAGGADLSRADKPNPRLCGSCSSAPFTAARACGIYAGAFEASVLFLKSTPHVCPRLRTIIARVYSSNVSALRADIVVPVPLHVERERKRGFNQATIIGRIVSRRFGVELDEYSLKRTRATERHRAGMDAGDRARSVDGAFNVVRPRLIEGASALLVDDVYTTGSTIGAASRALIEAGARRVNVLTIARVRAG